MKSHNNFYSSLYELNPTNPTQIIVQISTDNNANSSQIECIALILNSQLQLDDASQDVIHRQNPKSKNQAILQNKAGNAVFIDCNQLDESQTVHVVALFEPSFKGNLKAIFRAKNGVLLKELTIDGLPTLSKSFKGYALHHQKQWQIHSIGEFSTQNLSQLVESYQYVDELPADDFDFDSEFGESQKDDDFFANEFETSYGKAKITLPIESDIFIHQPEPRTDGTLPPPVPNLPEDLSKIIASSLSLAPEIRILNIDDLRKHFYLNSTGLVDHCRRGVLGRWLITRKENQEFYKNLYTKLYETIDISELDLIIFKQLCTIFEVEFDKKKYQVVDTEFEEIKPSNGIQKRKSTALINKPTTALKTVSTALVPTQTNNYKGIAPRKNLSLELPKMLYAREVYTTNNLLNRYQFVDLIENQYILMKCGESKFFDLSLGRFLTDDEVKAKDDFEVLAMKVELGKYSNEHYNQQNILHSSSSYSYDKEVFSVKSKDKSLVASFRENQLFINDKLAHTFNFNINNNASYNGYTSTFGLFSPDNKYILFMLIYTKEKDYNFDQALLIDVKTGLKTQLPLMQGYGFYDFIFTDDMQYLIGLSYMTTIDKHPLNSRSTQITLWELEER